MSSTQKVKEAVSILTVSSAPSTTKRHGEWVEAVCAIGKDEVAYITMHKDAYDELMSQSWD